MKSIYLLILIILTTTSTFAQTQTAASKENYTINEPPVDTTKQTFFPVEVSAEFPGGLNRFYQYVGGTLSMPDVVHLLGFNGRAVVSFVVNVKGQLTQIKPVTHSGMGIEEAIMQVLARSPLWKPAYQNGNNIIQKMALPFTFKLGVDSISILSLRQAQDGYVFKIKDTLRTIDQTEKMLGPKFLSTQIDHVAEYTGTEAAPKDKKKVYLVYIKP